jgi:tetratricopeptide (TPR) repeat protein
MNEALSIQWNEARRREAAGDVAGAKAAYEALLAIEPMQVVPQLRLSRFAQASDRYVEAHARALHASRIASVTRISKDVGFVSLRLLAFAEDAEVARLIKALDWSDPEVLKQAAVLSQHLWLVGQLQLALDFLTHVGSRVRPNHLLSFTRANVLRSLGRLQEATEHYEYALQLSPHDSYVHRALAYHQPSTPPGARLPRIRAAQRQHPAGSPEQAQLFYALFKELDDLGDTDAAWRALESGAAIVRDSLPHDPAREAARFDALKAFMPSKAMHDSRPDADRLVPIFIVGMPRTGTTLLDRILGNRPDTVSMGERNDFEAAVSEASDHFYAGGLKETAWDKLERIDFRKAGELYLERVARLAEGSAFCIDKNPQNFFSIPLILRALPNARILCLQRDPMDACFSNLKEPFEGGAYPYSYALEDLAAHQRGFTELARHWQALEPHSVRLVPYEDLVRNGEESLRGLLAFCGMEPVEGMLDIVSNQAPVSTASSSQVRQPINERGIGAWKRYASQLQPLHRLLEATS